jgi:hypothetical protein
MTYEEAEAWCADELAVVEWISVVGQRRCRVSVGGHRMLAERDTFCEAVTAAATALTQRRAARSSPPR